MSVRPGTLLGRFAFFFFFAVAELELWDVTLPRGGDARPGQEAITEGDNKAISIASFGALDPAIPEASYL